MLRNTPEETRKLRAMDSPRPEFENIKTLHDSSILGQKEGKSKQTRNGGGRRKNRGQGSGIRGQKQRH
jgi:hypothetical protein